ncbi:MAG: hypothetical protein N3A01_08515 [Bacteroidales bacterium]|nr:hypothetical protein [Bacteroidales bacterium]
MTRFLKWYCLIFIVFLLKGCTQTEQESTITEEDLESRKSEAEKIAIKIPSPIETYSFLYFSEVKFSKENMNQVSNHSKYLTKEKKALNLGVYASDLSYCVVFKQSNYALDYFSVSKKIAEDLGLLEGFNEDVIKRVDNNISNIDSLYQITNDSYTTAIKYLEAKGNSDILPLILTGAWIETMNIAVKSVKKFNPKNEIISRIRDEIFVLESLLKIYETLNLKEQYKQYYTWLDELYFIYTQIDENKGITEEQFNDISTQIKKIRALIIS